jgi:hypothetical protein
MIKHINAKTTLSKKEIKETVKILEKSQVKPITYFYFNRRFPFIHKTEMIDVVDMMVNFRGREKAEAIDKAILNTLKKHD